VVSRGRHVIDMDSRLRTVWRNSRPIYVIVHDPDDDELYYGNLARMADVMPLDQDIAATYDALKVTKKATNAFTNISRGFTNRFRV
jgi:hypothetical protein